MQAKPTYVDKDAWELLQNFQKFGVAAKGDIDEVTNLPPVMFDEGALENNVEEKFTKDKDLVELERIKKEEFGIGDDNAAGNQSRGIRDEFDTTTYVVK